MAVDNCKRKISWSNDAGQTNPHVVSLIYTWSFWCYGPRERWVCSRCSNLQSLWWGLHSSWKLILNSAQRGRLIVTSAPFNAARDQENWINWHQHFCSFKNNWVITFPVESIKSICTLSEKIKQDKSLKCWIRCQRSLSAAHVENSRHAGERRRAGRGSTRLLMMLRPPAVGWRWQQSLFPASRLSNFWSQKSFQGKEMLGYGSQQVWSVVL